MTALPVSAAPSPAPTELPDRLLTRAVAEGDDEAFNVLTERYWSWAYWRAHDDIWNHDTAEDVAQAAMMALLDDLRAGKEIDPVRTWLRGIVRKLILTRWRQDPVAGSWMFAHRHDRTLRAELLIRSDRKGPEYTPPWLSIDPPDPLTGIMREEDRAELKRTLELARENFTRREREVFFRWLQKIAQGTGRPRDGRYHEVGEELGISSDNARLTARRASRKLQRLCARGAHAEPHPSVKEILAWRARCGLTAADVARRFGVSKETVRNWEIGMFQPPSLKRVRATIAEHEARVQS